MTQGNNTSHQGASSYSGNSYYYYIYNAGKVRAITTITILRRFQTKCY